MTGAVTHRLMRRGCRPLVARAIAIAALPVLAGVALTGATRPGSPVAVRAPAVWVVDSLTRVTRTEGPGEATVAVVKAARNESRSFQIVIRAPDDRALSDVDVVASDLVGPVVMSAGNLSLFREHYVRVSRPSPGSPYPPGWWPDALIPFVDPDTGRRLSGGRFAAAPFRVPAGENQPVWVDVHVPRGTPPGTYRGALTVRAGTTTLETVPLRVEVWDFALPDRPALRSDFGSLRRLRRYHGWPDGHEDAGVVDRMAEWLLAHRVQLAAGPSFPLGPGGAIEVSPEGDAEFRAWLARRSAYRIPFYADWPFADPLGADRPAALEYLRSFARYLRSREGLQRAYVYVVDEPSSAAAYRQVRDFAALVHEADPGLRLLVTEQPTPEDSQWGSLVGAVDIWTPLFELFDPAAVTARMRAGEEVWTYTALAQGAAQGIPVWLLDYPLVHYRVHAWINARYRVTGVLYWSVLAGWTSVDDPWTNPATYLSGRATFNGEGTLVYPGRDVGSTGPVASIRLKALRDGFQDFDYLARLRELGDADFAMQLAIGIGASWTTWSREPAALDEARERAARRILWLGQAAGGLRDPDVGPPHGRGVRPGADSVARVCFAILAHEAEDCLEDLLDSLERLAPGSTSVLYNGGRDPEFGKRAGLPICSTSGPLSWGWLGSALLDLMTWVEKRGIAYEYLVYLENDMLLIKPGFEAFLDRELREHDYMAVNFHRVSPGDFWLPGQRFLATWRPTWQPLLATPHPFGCFNPGQVFRRGAVRAILQYPQLSGVRRQARRSRVPVLEEVLNPTLAVAAGARAKPYPEAQARAIRWRRYHAFEELASYHRDPEVFLVHPVGMTVDSPDRALLRRWRRSPEADLGPLPEPGSWPPPRPPRTRVQATLSALRTMWVRLHGR